MVPHEKIRFTDQGPMQYQDIVGNESLDFSISIEDL